jgi:hypothetical protein
MFKPGKRETFDRSTFFLFPLPGFDTGTGTYISRNLAHWDKIPESGFMKHPALQDLVPVPGLTENKVTVPQNTESRTQN